ncbi:hypothetical protein ACRAWD_16035 [Caulobacter segnis]
MLPARYPATTQERRCASCSSRATAWRKAPLGDRGVGQKLWSLGGDNGDGEDVGVLALRRLVFA